MLDHFGFRVRDLASARRFYDAALRPLGLATMDNGPTSFLVVRSADDHVPFLWIGTDRPNFWRADDKTSSSPIHVAFAARDKAAVDAFHMAAIGNGGVDNGPPGPRGPKEMGYYAAFAIDPDGNNIEAGFRDGG
ncbi:MAG: VOC family protein [Rhizobiaceae bacterium]|nr:VOC family protein [Rhizobiaceae bacterium]